MAKLNRPMNNLADLAQRLNNIESLEKLTNETNLDRSKHSDKILKDCRELKARILEEIKAIK